MGKLPGDDEAIIEGHAAEMSVKQNIDFHTAKEALISEYKKNVSRSMSGGKVDVYKFQEEMDKYITKHTK